MIYRNFYYEFKKGYRLIIDKQLMFEIGICASAIYTYHYRSCRSWKTDIVKYSIDDIQERLGYKRHKQKKALDLLEAKGLIIQIYDKKELYIQLADVPLY